MPKRAKEALVPRCPALIKGRDNFLAQLTAEVLMAGQAASDFVRPRAQGA
ncbi:hypothetical protein GCM10022281_04980 [Sphingomonas rosea]|uniref:Uncharacterized protein n=1 Tax=Sphingomonas rosea TaxID=335605 RepID=A0ABP7TP78_9SPHN